MVVLVGLAITFGSLAYSYSYTWNTSNHIGDISYQMRNYGLPLQYINQEVSSPVGPSSYFKLSAGYFAIDIIVWALVYYGVLLAMRRSSRARAPSPQNV